MTRGQPRAVAAVVVAFLAATACQSYRPIETTPEAGATVRISYATPRAVGVRPATGQTVTAEGVTEIVGRVDRMSADTVLLRLQNIRGPNGIIPDMPIGGLVAVAREPGVRVERQRFSLDRTLGLTLGGGAALFGLFLLFNRGEHDIVY